MIPIGNFSDLGEIGKCAACGAPIHLYEQKMDDGYLDLWWICEGKDYGSHILIIDNEENRERGIELLKSQCKQTMEGLKARME